MSVMTWCDTKRLLLKHWWLNPRLIRQAELYLKSVSGELGLREIKLLIDHYNRKLYFADSDRGPLYIKLYFENQFAKARRSIFFQTILRDRGFHPPAAIYHDIEDKPQKTRLACVVLGRVEGSMVSPDVPAMVREAFILLGRLHGVDPSECSARNDLEPATRRLLRPLDKQWSLATIDSNIGLIRRVAVAVNSSVADRFARKLKSRIAAIHDEVSSTGLLHLDYSPSNLIHGFDGTMHVLDLDNISFGCPAFDLALALLHFRFGLRSEALAQADLDVLCDPASYTDLLAAYFGSAPAWIESLWNRQHRPLMLWAYLKSTGNLAFRAVDPIRFDRRERRAFFDRTRAQWNRLIAYETVWHKPV